MAIQSGIELAQPNVVAFPDPTIVDGIIAGIEAGKSIQQSGYEETTDPVFLELAKPIGENLQILYGLDPTEPLRLRMVEAVRNVTQPGEPFNIGAVDWHQDGDSGAKYFVLVTTAFPTEILTGNIDLSNISMRLGQRALSGELSASELFRIEQYLSQYSDEELPSLGLGMAQLRPYLGYHMGLRNYHRSPINNSDDTVERGELRFHFGDPEEASER